MLSLSRLLRARHWCGAPIRTRGCVSRRDDVGAGERELLAFLRRYQDWEKVGVPADAGSADTCSAQGFALEGMKKVLRILGEPHAAYWNIHVTGSKGKGSTAVMLASTLRAVGVKTGGYTSPHVRTIRERLTTAASGSLATDEEMGELVAGWGARLDGAMVKAGVRLTHFEALTALAFLHFAERGCEAAVVEVGLGGSKDATNVIPGEALACAAVTNIGEEHVAALGGSVAAVARAKVGIAKVGRPFVVGEWDDASMMKYVHDLALQRGARVTMAASSVNVSCVPRQGETEQMAPRHEEQWLLKTQVFGDFTASSRLVGAHQRRNAATAVAALSQMKLEGLEPLRHVTADAIVRGLGASRLLGRFQVFPLSGFFGFQNTDPAYLLFDGAHTPAAAAALVGTLRETVPGNARLCVVTAMASDKNLDGFAGTFAQVNPERVFCFDSMIAGSNERTARAEDLRRAWSSSVHDSSSVVVVKSLEEGLSSAASHFREERRSADDLRPLIVVVTGSLHIFGSVSKVFEGESSAANAAEDTNT